MHAKRDLWVIAFLHRRGSMSNIPTKAAPRLALARFNIRCAIIGHIIAQLLFPEIRPRSPHRRLLVITIAGSPQIVPQSPPSAPALRAADQGVTEALESVLSDNTRRVYQTQWKLFTGWCDEVGLSSLPAEPLTVARYLAARAGSGASMATLCLATSAISKAHEWAKLESPCGTRACAPL